MSRAIICDSALEAVAGIPDGAVFLIQPDGVVARDLFGIDFGTLTALIEVPLADATQKAIP